MIADTQRLAAALADRYRIEREIGAGGMATVYLAHDIKHDRKVALKVLKPELAAVLGADRFVVEIKTTASLQHPHILPLFDSGTADGFLFYVMPYIDGETLRDKLNRETQLGIDEAVRITREVADALEYAHGKGIIHRDIKPENILLANGRPMVADFGIALAVSAAAGGRMTETGLSLGTPHYMSPEQATADKEITARSDIYSLASMLYEMLAGNPPHTGSSAQQIIVKIIADPTRPVSELRKSVPANVAAAVAKALEKLPADRFESASRFAAALADPAYAGSTTTIPGRRISEESKRWRGRALIACAAVLLLSVPAFRGMMRPRPDTTRPWRVRIALPDSAPVDGSLSLSNDGSVLVYDGGGRIWKRTAEVSEPIPIAGTEGGAYPVISPNGRNVAFLGWGKVSVVALEGGAPRILSFKAQLGATFGWLDDDHIVLPDVAGLMRIPVAGGDVVPLTAVDTAKAEVVHLHPSGLPGGNGAVFTIASRDWDSSYIAVVGPQGGSVTKLFPGNRAVVAPPGHLIVTRQDGSIAAVPFDFKRHRVTGSPVTIASGLRGGSFTTIGMTAVSATGRLIYVADGWGGASPPADLVWVSRNGAAVPVDTGWTGAFQSVALSADGRRAAVGLYTDRNEELQVRELSTGSLTNITIPGAILRDPVFSPDGKLYFVGMGASHGLHRVDVNGTAPPKRVAAVEFVSMGNTAITPAGDYLYMTKYLGTGGSQLVRYRASDWTSESTVMPVGAIIFHPQVSPDGRWLAFMLMGPGQPEVHVRSTDPARPSDWRIATVSDPMTSLRWSFAGAELFFVSNDSMMVASVTTAPSFTAGTPRALFSMAGRTPAFDVGRDGRFLVIRSRPDLRQRTELVMLERWTELLRR